VQKSLKKLVCFDTHILIWGVEKTSHPQQSDMIIKTGLFLEHLKENNIEAIIPSVVLSEFLMHVPKEKIENYLSSFQKHYIIAPFDAMAAIKFAKIWQSKSDDETIKRLINDGFRKNCLKIDSMIIATAITRNAECIYSHDNGLQKFASGDIDVREVPSLPGQLNL